MGQEYCAEKDRKGTSILIIAKSFKANECNTLYLLSKNHAYKNVEGQISEKIRTN